MTKPAGAAFFSYSRHDTEFAQRLAQELRAAGATIWLDQLDIRPGQRWDRSVQEAVARCPRMLVILSPDSVESENVMDELSFALEKKKTVIPVLYRDCEIPFRIGRVQYVDFRSDHDKALKELLDTLNAIERDEEENSHNIGEDKEDKPKPVASQTATEQHVPALKSAPGVEKPQPERATKPTQEQVILRKSPEGTSVLTGKARMMALVAAAVLVIALGLLWANHGRSSKPNAVGVTVSPSNSTAATWGVAPIHGASHRRRRNWRHMVIGGRWKSLERKRHLCRAGKNRGRGNSHSQGYEQGGPNKI